MTTREILSRAIATFVQASTAVLIGSGTGLIDAAVWQAAAVGGLGALIAFAHRTAGSYLNPGSGSTGRTVRVRRQLTRDDIPD